MTQLTFLSWSREQLADHATGTAHGRARAETTITLRGTDPSGAPSGEAQGTVAFLLAGPADVTGLQPGVVATRYPAPGTLDHESDRCPHVELRDPGLPWRYTPAGNPPAGGHQRPWLVLVVGTEDEVAPAGDRVTLAPAVQAAHPLGEAATGAYPWAHVQVDDGSGRRLARLLSGRRLDAGTDYVAALVPAFAPDGTPSWTGVGPVVVALHDHWRFRTANPPGSFEDLAGALRPGAAAPTTGRAPLRYPGVSRLATAALSVRGALAPLGEGDPPLHPQVVAHLAGLRLPVRDEVGRPIVGLPRHGDAWVPDPDATTWGATLNGDPRHRGVAGLGTDLAVELQEDLAAEAKAQVGALSEARQRIARLVAGVAASTALWERRLPVDPLRRLWVLGPGLRRVVTPDGAVADLATAADRALPRGLFSTAARRLLRPGPARTALAPPGAADPADLLPAANRCRPAPGPVDDGLAVDVDFATLEDRRKELVERGTLDLRALGPDLRSLADRARRNGSRSAVTVADRLLDALQRGRPAPWLTAMALLAEAASTTSGDPGFGRLQQALADLVEHWDRDAVPPGDLLPIIDDMGDPPPEEPPCRPVDLVALAAGADAAFDPRPATASAKVRVLATVSGVDPAQPLAPPEVCVGLDRPVWKDVAERAPEWLLPGGGQLEPDALIAVETNPVFVESLLVGLNARLLAELRWRNIPVATGCTPLRTFWDRAEPEGGARLDDIRSVSTWLPGTGLGSPDHMPTGVTGGDLVLVIRSELFRRYPSTLLYLVAATSGFAADPPPGAARVLPTFQGRLAPDVTFFGFQGFPAEDVAHHWLVLEEPPAGYRFANDAPGADPASDGATWAAASFADPVRVLVRGDALDPS